jgi:MFS family permease
MNAMVQSAPVVQSLKTNARFRRFWLGRLFANTAQNAILFALLVIVVNRTGSTVHSSLLVLSFIVPAAIFGIVGGVVVDHLPKRGVLVCSSLLRAVLSLAFLRSSESVWIIYAVNLALSAVSQFSGPAESAVVPSLVEDGQIASATALLNIGVIVAQVLGSVLLAPIFLKTVGADPLFLTAILLFLGGAIAYAFMPRAQRRPAGWMREHEEPRFRGLRSSATESWHMLRGNRSVFLAGVQQTVVTTTLVVLMSLLPNYTHSVLKLPTENAVFVFAPAALGVALGNWLVPKLVRRRGKSTLCGIGFFMFLICLASLGFGEQLARFGRDHSLLGPVGAIAPGVLYGKALFASLMAIPLGFGYAVILVTARLITYEHIPGHMQGRVFAFQGVLTSLASIVPLLMAGVFTHLLGPRIVLVALAVADLAALLFARSTLPRGGVRPGATFPAGRQAGA